jgi:hypothetical protein
MAERTYNQIHHPNIVKEYEERGLKAPFGRGIHTLQFHKIAAAQMAKGKSRDDAYRIAMGSLGVNKAVNPSHRKMARYLKKKRRI